MPIVVLIPGGTVAAGDGGKSQVNFNFLQDGGDYSFLNLLKMAQAWFWSDNTNAPVTPDILDSNGYPTTILHGGVTTVFHVPSQASRPGNYVITWDGNGTISCGMSNTLVNGSKVSTLGSGSYEFSTTDDRFVIGIAALGSPGISNMKVYHIDDVSDVLAGKLFGNKFKQRLFEGNFGVLRFLNWQEGNSTNVSYWADRKPASYVFYQGYELRSSLYAGVTTNVGNAYSVAAPSGWGGLVDRAMVHLVFNASATQSGTCSLNVGGSGVIDILDPAGTELNLAPVERYPVGGTSQSLATLAYDATLNGWVKFGGDTSIGDAGLFNGVPPELMVQLCTEVGAHPHFVSPWLACTPMTDWHTQLAIYCRNIGPSWMAPRFEGPNECWNGQFYQTAYAKNVATAYGWGADFDNWYGKAMSTIGQAVSAVYSNHRSRYQVLCGIKTGIAGDTSTNPRLASTLYLLQTPQSGYTASAASGWVTHACCAQYIGPSDDGTAAEVTLAVAFAGGDNTAPGTYVDTLNSGAGSFTLSACATLYASCKSWAAGFGVNKMCGYEGGYSPDYSGGTTVAQVAGATKATQCVVTMSSGVGYANQFNNLAALVGLYVKFDDPLGGPIVGMTQLNGNTYQITAVSGLNLTLNVNSTGFGAYSSGGSFSVYVDASATISLDVWLNNLRAAGKNVSQLQTYTTTNYNNFVSAGGEFPSCFQLSGPVPTNNVWSVLEDIYESPDPPQWLAFRAFNPH